jgi:integrase
METRLASLRQEVLRYKSLSLAKTTQSVYKTHLKTFLRFCCFYGCTPVPVEHETLCCYVAFLARSLSPSSVNSYLNIIRILHLDAGLVNPLDNWELAMIKRGVNRMKGQPPKQKFPITLSILREIFPLLDHFSSPLDISFWAACLIAFFGFFRKSTILPASVATAVGSGICRSDVQNLGTGSFDLVVRHTKTIQFGQRILTLPFYACDDPRLCPVRALHSHLTSSPVSRENHLFSYFLHGRIHLITHSVFVKKLKGLIVATGRSPADYSAHSFRRGGTSFAFSLNMPLLHVKSRGDWKSNCVERYITFDADVAKNSARLLAAGSSYV